MAGTGGLGPASRDLAEHLLAGGLGPAEIEAAQAAGPDLIHELWRVEGLDQAALMDGLSSFFGLPVAYTLDDEYGFGPPADVPPSYFKKHLICPLRKESGTLTVALAEPHRRAVLDDLRIIFDVSRMNLLLAPPEEIRAGINRLYSRQSSAANEAIQRLDEEAADLSWSELEEAEDLMDATSDAPVVKLVNSLLVEAVKRRSSDVHIEPYRDSLKVRYRIDGLLYDVHSPARRLGPAISARIKVMSGLDIAERRLPQDGRFQIRVADQEIDVRVSVVPTSFGERIVLRLLNKVESLLTLADLGLGQGTVDELRRLIGLTSGIILVTGPTGSGKTTTLYAALSEINTPEKNILTVEDPIEYQVPGLGQMQVNPAIELTFARALRSILRHDPDVLMVGEIRDGETARIAIHASQTGHLVFSTLHTNDAAGAVTRLVDMGVEPFLIASSLSGVVAQRLVRRICPDCRVEADYPSDLLAELGLAAGERLYKGAGCPTCFETGFQGRVGIFELLTLDEGIKELVLERSSSGRIAARAVELGLQTLLKDGADKVRLGLTTPEEVLRVVHA